MVFSISNFFHPIVVSEIVSFSSRFSGKNLSTSNFLRNFVLENRYKNKQIFAEKNYSSNILEDIDYDLRVFIEDNEIETSKYIINNIDGYMINYEFDDYDTGIINPLKIAIINGYFYIFKHLLKHPNIDVNVIYDSGKTAIFAVISSYLREEPDRNKTFTLLLKRPDIDINDKNKYGQTALIEASAYKNTEEFVRLLLKHRNIDINIQSPAGNTALIKAASFNNVNVVKMLLDRPDIDLFIKNNKNENALERAIDYGSVSKSEEHADLLIATEMVKIDADAVNETVEKIKKRRLETGKT